MGEVIQGALSESPELGLSIARLRYDIEHSRVFTISSQTDNLAIDLTIEINSDKIIETLIIWKYLKFLEASILEKDSDTKRVLIFHLVSEDADHLLLDVVGESLIQVDVVDSKVITLSNTLLKLVMAHPLFFLSAIVR